MRIHIPANYPPETLVLFVMSTWHLLIALLISRVGVLQPSQAPQTEEAALQGSTLTPEGV